MTRARDLANIADGTFTATDLDLSGTLTVSGDATFDTNTLFVDVSANAVGIGTTSPTNKIHAFSSSSTETVAKFSATNYGNLGTTYIELGTQYGDGGSRIGNINPSGNYGTLVFESMTATSGVYQEHMRVDQSGNVLVGKSSNAISGQSSSIQSNAIVSTSGPLNSHTSSAGVFEFNTNKVAIRAYGATAGTGHIAFNVGGGGGSPDFEAARIDSSGTLYVGATGSHLTSKLNVVQPSNNIAGYIFASASGGYTSTVFIAQGNQGTTNESYTIADFINSNASGRCKIYDSGDVDNTNGAYGSLSDVKLKTDIADAGSQWDDIKAIRFRKYKMIADPEQRVQMGVIAQELEEAGMSGLVRETADKDIEGNDLGTTTKSVKYSILYTKAVKALQEAMARIETLEAEVAALKGA